MIHYRKLLLERSRFQLRFTLENLREDVPKISQFIYQLLLCESTAPLSREEIARLIVKAYLAGETPLSNTLFHAEGDCVKGDFRCWIEDLGHDLATLVRQGNFVAAQ